MQKFSVTVPCRPHIRKYICARYSIIGNVIPLDNKSEFNETVLTKIMHQPVKKLPQTTLRLYLDQLTDEIKFELPIDLFYRIVKELTPMQFYVINRYLDNVFYSDLNLVISVAGVFGVPKRKTIITFAEAYDIDITEDFTLEGIRKSANRYAASPTARNFFLANLSQRLFDLDLRS